MIGLDFYNFDFQMKMVILIGCFFTEVQVVFRFIVCYSTLDLQMVMVDMKNSCLSSPKQVIFMKEPGSQGEA